MKLLCLLALPGLEKGKIYHGEAENYGGMSGWSVVVPGLNYQMWFTADRFRVVPEKPAVDLTRPLRSLVKSDVSARCLYVAALPPRSIVLLVTHPNGEQYATRYSAEEVNEQFENIPPPKERITKTIVLYTWRGSVRWGFTSLSVEAAKAYYASKDECILLAVKSVTIEEGEGMEPEGNLS